MLDFLRCLKSQCDHKVFLIVDDHAVHRLNPDELLNYDVKANAVRVKHSSNGLQLHFRDSLPTASPL